MNILPQYKGFRTATQKLFLLNRPFPSAFSRTIFHICSVLKLLETICSNAHFKIGASNSWGAMHLFSPSVILLTYPNGAVPSHPPSSLPLRIPWRTPTARRSIATHGAPPPNPSLTAGPGPATPQDGPLPVRPAPHAPDAARPRHTLPSAVPSTANVSASSNCRRACDHAGAPSRQLRQATTAVAARPASSAFASGSPPTRTLASSAGHCHRSWHG